MSFFQNVFDAEFRANLFSSDRKLQSTFKINANIGNPEYFLSVEGPFDLTGNINLTINYAYDPAFLGYASLTIDVSGTTVGNTKTSEIVSKLNSNITFADLFVASETSNKILIKTKRNKSNFKSYISNAGAETIILFNKKAPVAELPSYFERYAFENRFTYPNLGSLRLVLLDPANPVDASVITNAGLDPLNPTPDWKLLAGCNDAYWFYKRTFSSGKLAEEIKYPAGASEGDLAKKTYYTYSGSDVIEIMEIPYVLQSGDLVTPP